MTRNELLLPHVRRPDRAERAKSARSSASAEAQAERMRELEEAQTALTEQATHDALTGLPNRNLLIDRLTQALALASARDSRPA